MFSKNLTLVAGSLLALAACGEAATGEEVPPGEETAPAPSATAQLMDLQGNVVGNALVSGLDGSLMVDVSVLGLPPGLHGAHIHERGDCSAIDFSTADGHWNPDNTNHGTESEPPNPHAGDIGNIEVGEDGSGQLSGRSSGTFAGLLDRDGSAFIIHADPDDMVSQPSGNAGERIACGVFVAN